jgi:hypothetical protein
VDGCWSGIDDGCELELGAVLGAVLGDAGVLCATAKPLPSTTINASLFKFLTSILRFPFLDSGPSATDTRIPRMSDEARVIGAILAATVELDASLYRELAHPSRIRELLECP